MLARLSHSSTTSSSSSSYFLPKVFLAQLFLQIPPKTCRLGSCLLVHSHIHSNIHLVLPVFSTPLDFSVFPAFPEGSQRQRDLHPSVRLFCSRRTPRTPVPLQRTQFHGCKPAQANHKGIYAHIANISSHLHDCRGYDAINTTYSSTSS